MDEGESQVGEDIVDDDLLYRRILPYHIRADGSISSAAFKRRKKPDPELSVDLARLTTPEASQAAGGPAFGVIVLSAGAARAAGCTVTHDRLPGNPAHCVIEGAGDSQTCRRLAEASRLLIPAGNGRSGDHDRGRREDVSHL